MTDIVIAYGVHVRDWPKHKEVLDYLNAKARKTGPSHWMYPKNVDLHRVEIIYTKAEFALALDKKDAVVIYDGHSRIGQGPVFGPENVPACPDKTKFPTNPWGDHFRMGWDFASVECLMDIIYHGTNPKEYTLPKGDPKAVSGPFASGGLIKVLSDTIKAGNANCRDRIGWRELSTCWDKASARKDCNGATPLSKRHYWRHFWNSYLKAFDFETFVEVGTADLDATKLACSVLYMNSCSSLKYYYWPLLRHKNNVKSSCVFYLTRTAFSGQTTLPFLKLLLGGADPIKEKDLILQDLSGVDSSGDVLWAE